MKSGASTMGHYRGKNLRVKGNLRLPTNSSSVMAQVSSLRSQVECWKTEIMKIGNPLVVNAACGVGLSGAQRARINDESWGNGVVVWWQNYLDMEVRNVH
jgi:hypothetical protein